MDALIEFCRTGQLGQVAVGLNGVELEELLGPPSSTRDVHGEPNQQRYRYGNLSLRLSGDFSSAGDRSRLRVRSITVSFGKTLALPEPIARTLVDDWSSPRLTDVLDRLRLAGVSTELIDEDQADGIGLMRRYRVGESTVVLDAVDDEVDFIRRPADPI